MELQVDISVIYFVLFFIIVSYSIMLNIVFGHKSFWKQNNIFEKLSRNNNSKHINKIMNLNICDNNIIYNSKHDDDNNNYRNNNLFYKNKFSFKYLLNRHTKNNHKIYHLLLEKSSDDIIINICSYLHCHEMLNLCKTSHRYYQLINHCNYLWKNLLFYTMKYINNQVLNLMKTSRFYCQFQCHFNLYKVCNDFLDYNIDKTSDTKLDMKSKYHIIIKIILKYIIIYLIRYQRNIIIINNEIYDLTDFKYHHPGGYNIIDEYNGIDASYIFNNSAHSIIAKKYSRNFLLFSNLNYFYQSYFYNNKYTDIIEKLYIDKVYIIKRVIDIDFNDYQFQHNLTYD
jgi:hypothetical protein